jgi:hypothetical protein
MAVSGARNGLGRDLRGVIVAVQSKQRIVSASLYPSRSLAGEVEVAVFFSVIIPARHRNIGANLPRGQPLLSETAGNIWNRSHPDWYRYGSDITALTP